MGDFTNETKISDKPLYAKEILEVKLESPRHKKCGSCSSNNTICVYSDAYGCIIGYTIVEEFYCKDCKQFTAYIYEYES